MELLISSLGRWRFNRVEEVVCAVWWQMPFSLPALVVPAHLLMAAPRGECVRCRCTQGGADQRGVAWKYWHVHPCVFLFLFHWSEVLCVFFSRYLVFCMCDRVQVCVSPSPTQERGACVDVFMGLWINHTCVSVLVCVCVFKGAAGVRPLCTPIAATRPATCSGIREHADYTRHNGDTQTQICPRPTKDTWTASLLIAFSIFNIFRVWVIMSEHTTWQTMLVFVLTDAVRCSRKRLLLGYCYYFVWGGRLLPRDPQQIHCPTFQL